jgi:hypothetical protein
LPYLGLPAVKRNLTIFGDVQVAADLNRPGGATTPASTWPLLGRCRTRHEAHHYPAAEQLQPVAAAEVWPSYELIAGRFKEFISLNLDGRGRRHTVKVRRILWEGKYF